MPGESKTLARLRTGTPPHGDAVLEKWTLTPRRADPSSEELVQVLLEERRKNRARDAEKPADLTNRAPSHSPQYDATLASLSLEDVSRWLGTTPRKVRRWIHREKDPLPAFRVGRGWQLDRIDLLDWCVRQRSEDSTQRVVESDPKIARIIREFLASLEAPLVVFTRLVRTIVRPHAPRASKDRLLKPEEAAKILGVSRQFFYDHEAGLTFAVRLSNRHLRISERRMYEWINSQFQRGYQ